MNLVFGASSYIGTNLVPFLLAEGRAVRATARHLEVLEARDWQGCQLIRADALEPETLDAALEGIDVAYYLVHSMAAGPNFPELDAQAARNFAAAAARHGVQRIVYLGGLAPPTPVSRHLKSRRETGDILRRSPVAVTEIRAGIVVGPGSAAYEVIRDLVNHLPVMLTPRWVRSRSTPIALSNVLRYLADAPMLAATANKIYDISGPEVLTYEALMRQYGELIGKHPWIIPVPVLSPRLSSYWLRLITSVPTNVGRALIDGLSQDIIARPSGLGELIPQRLLTFREAARAALEATRLHAVPARWVETATSCETFRPEYSFYPKRVSDTADTIASAAAIWRVLCRIGGDDGYFYANSLWWLRRAMDWCLGGPSFRRRRRHPDKLRVGDVVDAWRVIALEPDRRLTLLMEMKALGAGVLEFEIENRGDRRVVRATAYWHPAGVFGLLYWYALLPAHAFLFAGLTRSLARRAERLEGSSRHDTENLPAP